MCSEGRPSVPSLEVSTVPGSQARKTILLVDDDLSYLRMLQEALKRQGHRVYTATDASEAEEMWAKARRGIDVVLCDHYLGPDRGSELVQRFKSHEPAVKMVLCSGAESMDVPGVEFLMKPFTPSALREALS